MGLTLKTVLRNVQTLQAWISVTSMTALQACDKHSQPYFEVLSARFMMCIPSSMIRFVQKLCMMGFDDQAREEMLWSRPQARQLMHLCQSTSTYHG